MLAGHSLEEIRDYPIKKFSGFINALDKIELERVKSMAIAHRVAGAEKKDFEKFLKG